MEIKHHSKKGIGILIYISLELFILKAIREANALSSATLGEEVQGSKETAESKKEEKSEEKGASDEDVSSGLGALFG